MITVGVPADNGAAVPERCAAGTLPLLEEAGVTIRGRYQGAEMLVGEGLFDLVAVREFSDVDAMKRFLASDAYAAMLTQRCFLTVTRRSRRYARSSATL